MIVWTNYSSRICLIGQLNTIVEEVFELGVIAPIANANVKVIVRTSTNTVVPVKECGRDTTVSTTGLPNILCSGTHGTMVVG